MHITTKFVSSNSTHDEVYLIEHYENKFVNNLSKVGCFLRSHQFPTPIQTDHHNIAEMCLKVVLNTFLCLYSKKSKVGETWTYHLEAKSILTFCLFCHIYDKLVTFACYWDYEIIIHSANDLVES
jgi:hypothetical protein